MDAAGASGLRVLCSVQNYDSESPAAGGTLQSPLFDSQRSTFPSGRLLATKYVAEGISGLVHLPRQ